MARVSKAKYHKLVNDLQYIKDKYGVVYDFCGAFCNNDKFEQLLEMPNLGTAYDMQVELLRHYFVWGAYRGTTCERAPLPVTDDKKLLRIKTRWLEEGEHGKGD